MTDTFGNDSRTNPQRLGIFGTSSPILQTESNLVTVSQTWQRATLVEKDRSHRSRHQKDIFPLFAIPVPSQSVHELPAAEEASGKHNSIMAEHFTFTRQTLRIPQVHYDNAKRLNWHALAVDVSLRLYQFLARPLSLYRCIAQQVRRNHIRAVHGFHDYIRAMISFVSFTSPFQSCCL